MGHVGWLAKELDESEGGGGCRSWRSSSLQLAATETAGGRDEAAGQPEKFVPEEPLLHHLSLQGEKASYSRLQHLCDHSDLLQSTRRHRQTRRTPRLERESHSSSTGSRFARDQFDSNHLTKQTLDNCSILKSISDVKHSFSRCRYVIRLRFEIFQFERRQSRYGLKLSLSTDQTHSKVQVDEYWWTCEFDCSLVQEPLVQSSYLSETSLSDMQQTGRSADRDRKPGAAGSMVMPAS